MSSSPYNILVLMTDQQRSVQHFPQAWVKKYLTNLNALKSKGITLNNAITNTCRCSPVRGMLWTSTYPPRNGVEVVGAQLTYQIPTLGYVLAYGDQAIFPTPAANDEPIVEPGPYYGINFNGKWHLGPSDFDQFASDPDALNEPTTQDEQNTVMKEQYGMDQWDSPDAGTSLSNVNTMGGGPTSASERWQNDARYKDDVISFINNYDGDTNFFAVASLVNPHDVWAYLPQFVYDSANTLQEAYPEFYYYVIDPDSTPPAGASRENEEFFIELKLAFNKKRGIIKDWLESGNYNDDLSLKPSVHTTVRDSNNPIYTEPDYDPETAEDYAVNYLRFYAYLNYLADQYHGEIYQALEDKGLLDSTIVLRLADHGETGCSHMGMVEKDFNMYNETIRVPVVFSNPVLWPAAVESDALMGVVDVFPTLMQFAGLDPADDLYQNIANASAPNAGQSVSMFQGHSWYEYVLDSQNQTPPVPSALFTYDDGNPWHIRGILVEPGTYTVSGVSFTLDQYYKYGVYFQYQSDGQINAEPYNEDSNPTGLQFEVYEDYTGASDASNAGETDNQFYSEWGKSYSDWSELHQNLHALLTQRLTGVDDTGPGNVYNPVTPLGWDAITN